MYEKTYPEKRFNITLDFLKTHAPPPQTILDLGVENPFSEIMKANGYEVDNTKGEDLDLDFKIVENYNTEITTAFEIFEHLLSPLQILQHIKSDYLFASVPLKLWFASAYKSKTDPWDRHYHEFEDWQFDWLLEKSGWEILDRKKFTHPPKKIGFRPILRHFVPRYYLVYCQKKS
ncbi:MAG: methyltransferase [Psychroflexus sp.]